MSTFKANPSSTGRNNSRRAQLLDRAIQLAAAGNPGESLQTLSHISEPSPEVINARGVCLMRLGRAAEAVRLFRSLVLTPNCTWMKAELPVIYRTNFSTSLMLAGMPMGARETLAEISEKSHPSVVRLQQAWNHWEQQLGLWQRFCLKLGLAPETPIAITFPAGDFIDAVPCIPIQDAASANAPISVSVQQLA